MPTHRAISRLTVRTGSRATVASAVAALLILSLLPDRWCGYADALNEPLTRLLAPVSTPARKALRHVRNGLGWLVGAAPPASSIAGGAASEGERSVRSPVEKLKELRRALRHKDERILSLRQRLDEARRHVRELQQLRKSIPDRAYVFRRAEITGRSVDSGVLQLDAGRRRGIVEGTAAVDGPNLVGRVVDVGPFSASVEPITSRGTPFNAVITPPRLPEKDLDSLLQKRRAQFEVKDGSRLVAVVGRKQPAEADDLVRLYDDGAWPDAVQGKVLGRVVRVERMAEEPLWKRVVARPAVSLRYLDAVTVIVPEKRVPDGGEGGGP